VIKNCFAAENQYTTIFYNVNECFAFLCVFLLLARFMVINGHFMVMFLGVMTSRKRSVAAGFGDLWSYGHYFF